MAELIELEEAWARIVSAAPVWPVQRVPLQAALGCVLAEDVCADRDWPPFHRCMVDGYALRSSDTLASPTLLKVIEDIPAGATGSRAVQAGEAARIMTGAPVPDGADAVVMVERTESPDRSSVRVLMTLRAGQNISKQGEDARAGAVVVPAGTVLNPGTLGILAFAGCHSIPVRRNPRVAILATGNELVEPYLPVSGAQIRNSNSYQLLAQCAEQHWPATYLGIARDTLDETRARISEGLGYDLLITTGGVSVGEHDYVGPVLREMSVPLAFNKVAIKPGKPTTFGVKNQTLVFGLPGNPVAAFVCFHIFVRTAVRKALGATDVLPRFQNFRAATALKSPGDRATFRPARLVSDAKGTSVEAIEWHGSGHLAALINANALLLQDANATIEAGQPVRTFLL